MASLMLQYDRPTDHTRNWTEASWKFRCPLWHTQAGKDGRQGCAQTKAPPVSWKGKRGYWLEAPVLEEEPRAARG